MNKTKLTKPRNVTFVKAGEQSRHVGSVDDFGLMTGAQDWELLVDVGKKLQIPRDIVITTLRPDIVLFSRKQKLMFFLELTVPWETRINESYERKRLKYMELQELCNDNGWKAMVFPIEVGCRGFVGTSLVNTLSKLGIRGKAKKEVIKKAGEAAEKASNWLWIKRNDTVWEGKS